MGAFVSRQRPWTWHAVPRRYSSLSQLYVNVHLPPGELRIRISGCCLIPNPLGAGSTPLSCDSLQPQWAVKTLLPHCPGCCEVFLACCPPLPSSSWQGTAGPLEQLLNNCCFSLPANLARRSRFDQCTWISAFSLDQGRRRDGRERALAGSLGTVWEAKLLLQEKPASK